MALCRYSNRRSEAHCTGWALPKKMRLWDGRGVIAALGVSESLEFESDGVNDMPRGNVDIRLQTNFSKRYLDIFRRDFVKRKIQVRLQVERRPPSIGKRVAYMHAWAGCRSKAGGISDGSKENGCSSRRTKSLQLIMMNAVVFVLILWNYCTYIIGLNLLISV